MAEASAGPAGAGAPQGPSMVQRATDLWNTPVAMTKCSIPLNLVKVALGAVAGWYTAKFSPVAAAAAAILPEAGLTYFAKGKRINNSKVNAWGFKPVLTGLQVAVIAFGLTKRTRLALGAAAATGGFMALAAARYTYAGSSAGLVDKAYTYLTGARRK